MPGPGGRAGVDYPLILVIINANESGSPEQEET